MSVLFLLVQRTDFFQDIAVPGAIAAVILLIIANSILNKMGWTLW